MSWRENLSRRTNLSHELVWRCICFLPLWLGLLIFHPFSGTINLTFINRVNFLSFQRSDYLSSYNNLSQGTHFLHRPDCANYLPSHIKAKTWAFSLQMLWQNCYLSCVMLWLMILLIQLECTFIKAHWTCLSFYKC